MKYTTTTTKMLADTFTPVSVYLKLRDVYPGAVLLESADHRAAENSYSYLCFEPQATFVLDGKSVKTTQRKSKPIEKEIASATELYDAFGTFISGFVEVNGSSTIANGIFGYITFDAVSIFENLRDDIPKGEIPLINYAFYRFVIAFNHFKDELIIYENIPEGESPQTARLLSLIRNKNTPLFPFKASAEEKSITSDYEFLENIKRGIAHCFRGDVFQVVFSRRFTRSFTGDDINVYRALRSINPSPYLFYFDYGGFRIMGSSPEAQLVVKNGIAKINPIAGTFIRTGDDEADRISAEKLAADEKENAEHVMLVDLARNDLSKHADHVQVNHYKDIHFYSHVIHLVSEVTGKLNGSFNPLALIADSFPAGTLSGAPKHRALQLIYEYEKHPRGFYGGCIGFIGFNGDINTAITIRTLLSKNHTLNYQAGAGVVAASVPQSELEEVNNKLRALRNAIEMANNLNA